MSYINTTDLRDLWDEAQTQQEWATTAFWEYIFAQLVFRESKWTVASQQPPTAQDNDLRRVDLRVRHRDDRHMRRTLLFMEAKRAGATLTQIKTVEKQALAACQAYHNEIKGSSVWAMTCVGSKMRLWAYDPNVDVLAHFWPLRHRPSTKVDYVEYATDGAEILRHLDFIKRYPTPEKHIFHQLELVKPVNPELPYGWREFKDQSSGTDGPVSAGQLQGRAVAPVLTLDANHAYRAVVVGRDEDSYLCNRLSGNVNIRVPKQAWVKCYVNVSGKLYPTFACRTESGARYYTWSLEPAQRSNKSLR